MIFSSPTARGRAGHGSMINRDNPITRLSGAIARIGAHEWPVQLTPTMQALLAAVGEIAGEEPTPENAERLVEEFGPAARMIGESFEAEWVAVRLGGGPERQWVAGQGVHPAGMSALLATTSAAGASLIAGPAGAIGVVCIGPRTTGEPLDEEDYGLLSMLTDHLGRVLTAQSQLDRLARVPGVVLAAQEQRRALRLCHSGSGL